MKTDSAAPIETEAQYKQTLQTLDRRQGPSLVLRLLMNALESYRQARKMGWSRPQNKLGLTVFQSFVLEPRGKDAELVQRIFALAQRELTELSEAERRFLAELAEDPQQMAFIFVHDLEREGRRFEGITFSLGRRAVHKARYRDRFDLILESEVIDGRSTGLTRLRAYVDPFRQPIREFPAREIVHEPAQAAEAEALFVEGQVLYAAWLGEPARHWSHWTTEYIDYFGPRVRPVEGSLFPTDVDLGSQRQSA